MQNKIIYGSELSLKLKQELALKIEKFEIKPKLAVILVGNNPASISYVTGKSKACKEVSIDYLQINYEENVSQKEIEDKIIELNKDDEVDGILVQLPLPRHINQDRIIELIDYRKDVDGFHPINVGKLSIGQDCLKPCTPLGIMKLLEVTNTNLEGKNVVVVGRSNLVGLPVSVMLIKKSATVTVCNSKTLDLKDVCKRADILIVAIGKAKFINRDYVKEGAIVIDVGVNRIDGKLCGDVDIDDVIDKVSYITPVPKGVGPMTICMLLHNTLEAYLKRRNYE